ncbi:mariner Mos1 transposase [Trichonephila clavipes]|nr:mariner Mos1 transposase [Trichonephila clavipes]
MLVEAYGGNILSRAQYYRWFEKFQNGDFDVRNEKRGRPAKKFEDAELQALFNEDDGQTQEHLAEQLNVDQSIVSRRLKAMGKIIKVGRWVPHELTDRLLENHVRNVACPLQTQVISPSNCDTIKNGFILRISNERPISIELLKTVNTDRYKQQLLNLNDAIFEKCEQYKKLQHKMIFLDDNAPSHRAKLTKDIVKALGWEPLAHAAYSPDLALSNYHLFASLGHTLADQCFTNYENVKSWLDDWLASKGR